MKKVIYSFLFCMCVINIHAQLTLEATLPGLYLDIEASGSQWKRVKPDGAYVYIHDYENNTISKYSSSDFSLIETLHVVSNGLRNIDAYQEIPDGLYKNDGEEYYLVWFETDETEGYDNKLGVYKKVGNDLVLDVTLYSNVYYIFKSSNAELADLMLPTEIWSNGTKCFIFVGTEDFRSIKVYSFAGTVSNVSQVKAENTEMRPYPNPSREKIHLTFDAVKEVSSIRICDINGKMVARIPVGSDATEYELDVHSYPEGVYFYEIDGKSQSFMVK